MGQMLDEEASKVDKIVEREKAVHLKEMALKAKTQEVEAHRENVLIQKQANEKISLELTQKQDEVE